MGFIWCLAKVAMRQTKADQVDEADQVDKERGECKVFIAWLCELSPGLALCLGAEPHMSTVRLMCAIGFRTAFSGGC
jgi:hypothetical protein